MLFAFFLRPANALVVDNELHRSDQASDVYGVLDQIGHSIVHTVISLRWQLTGVKDVLLYLVLAL